MTTVSWVALAMGAVWGTTEFGLSFTRRSDPGRARSADRATFQALFVTIVISGLAGVALGLAGVGIVPALYPEVPAVGVALLSAGIALRWMAIRTLKEFFTFDVAIHREHRVIQHGVYRFMRHPSYSGALLAFVGLGLALGSWASLVSFLGPIGVALAFRIRVEEAALRESLGAAYVDYCRRTARLIPWVF